MSQRSTLGEVLNWRNEIIHPRDFPSGKTVFVGLEHVESNSGRKIGELPLDLAKLTGRKARFYPGDLVYGYLRPYLNKLWVADRDGCCSVDQYVFSVREDRADRDYVAFFMRSPVYLKTAPVTGTPGQLPRIRVEEVSTVPIPLPALPEQRRIASILRERFIHLDRTKQMLDEQLRAVEKLPGAQLRDAFANTTAAKWPLVKLETIAPRGTGIVDGPFGSNLKTEHYRPSGARVVRLQNIGKGVFIGKHKAYVSWEHFETLTYHSVLPGDVVLAALGDGARPAGRACRVPDDFGKGLVKADCFRIRLPKDSVDPDFLVHFFNAPSTLAQVAEQMRGATRPRVTLGMLKARLVPLPELSTQRRVASELGECLESAERLRNGILEQIAALDLYPPALLRDAFTGAL